MIKAICLAILTVGGSLSGQTVAAEYLDGWTPENFYIEVAECKKSVVLPAAASYIKRGQEKKHEQHSLRNEAISMVPTFDAIATKVCYCAINEYAKDRSFGYQIGDDIRNYMQTPRCKAELASVMANFKERPTSLQLQ